MTNWKVLFALLISSPAFASGGHHEPLVIDRTVINKAIESTGKSAFIAADQIHHSENISGLQIGIGVGEADGRLGFAAGAAITIPGLGMFNGLITKEGDEIYRGLGYNKSFKP